MNKLTHIATALANSTLSKRAMTQVRGGIDPLADPLAPLTPAAIASMMDDEKRRERPGGGISTN
jgi:hypothetical protein